MIARRYYFVLLFFVTFSVSAQVKPGAAAPVSSTKKSVVLAGGCFWCMEPPFEKLNGVTEVVSGYSGGRTDKPTYEQVSSGTTGHIEVVKVVYDPKVISLKELLKVFWQEIDPLDETGQFCDKGEQYTSAIFFNGDEEKKIAEESKIEIAKSPALKNAKIVTALRPSAEFFPAEDYHQDYHKKNPIRYRYYRSGCGRDARLKKVWGK